MRYIMPINVQGNVTDVDLEYCKFVLDKQITVEAGHLLATSNKATIPIINSYVVLTGCELYEQRIFLKSTSNMIGDKYVSIEDAKQCEPFIKLIREYKLNFSDLLYIENLVEKVKKDNVFSTDFLTLRNITEAVQVKNLILKMIPFIAPEFQYNTLFDDSELATYNILTPRDHKLEENAEEIVCNVYWSHGVHSYQNKACLIGLLRVSAEMGFLILQDSFYFIVCQIVPDHRSEYSEKLSKLLNNFVLIRNYHIFLERTTDNPMIHYIFVNIRDIELLLSINRKNELEYKIDSQNDKVVTVYVKVKHRCTVSIKNKHLNCWIQCDIKTPNSIIFRECFLILHGNNFIKYPLMNSDDEYILTSDSKSFIVEINSFKSEKSYAVHGASVPVFQIPVDASLTLVNRIKNKLVGAIVEDFSFLSVRDIVEVIESNKRKHEEEKLSKKKTENYLITFEAIIKTRRTVSPKKNSAKPVDHKCFGIRGTQVHQIIFKDVKPPEMTRARQHHLNQTQLKVYDDDNLEEAERLYEEKLNTKPAQEQLLFLYLHNWQELQLPLGLVHNMKVVVRNVMNPKGSKYVKPTFLTRIEPVAYQPDQPFETAFEFVNNRNWGPPTPLSESHCIPANTVCWTPAITLNFTALAIKMRCNICKRFCIPGQQTCCNNGAQEDFKLDMVLALRGRDTHGVFDAVSREEKVLRMLLGVKETQWRVWKWAFRCLNWWTMNPNDFLELQDECAYVFRSYHENLLAESLTNKVVSFNKQACHNFDIKCRKLEKSFRDLNLNQKWYIVDIKIDEER